MCIAIVSKSDCDVINFEVKIYDIFPKRPKSRDKNLIILKTERAFKMK